MNNKINSDDFINQRNTNVGDGVLDVPQVNNNYIAVRGHISREPAAETVKRIKESAAYIRARFGAAFGNAVAETAGSAGATADNAADNAAGDAASAAVSADCATSASAPASDSIAMTAAAAPRFETAVVLGSGLGGFADSLCDAAAIPYADIPHFPRSTAPGHKGRLVAGAASPGGKKALCLQGRFHLYEGYSMREVTWYIRVLKELGVSRLILTNASGGMNPDWNVGDLMLILDHINYMGQNPLTGPNLDEYGPRFPDMTRVYDPEMRAIVRKAASALPLGLREGVYVAFGGPSYETPAEIRMFRSLGADAVGMSTVPEAIAANHCGIKVCGISCITNFAAGILDQPLTEAEVIETAGRTGPVFAKLIRGMLELLEQPEQPEQPE